MSEPKAAGQESRLEPVVGPHEVFRKEWFKTSECPSDFIPKGAEIFVGVDQGSPDGDYTVKGFYDPETGELHIQECRPNAD